MSGAVSFTAPDRIRWNNQTWRVTRVRDWQGFGYFQALARPNPDIDLPPDDRESGGLGILLVKQLMDDVEYEYQDGKNFLKIRKVLRPG